MKSVTIPNNIEYLQYNVTDDTEFTLELPNTIPESKDRIILLLTNASNTIYNLSWFGVDILWGNGITPFEIGDTFSSQYVLKIEFWENENTNTWIADFVPYFYNNLGQQS